VSALNRKQKFLIKKYGKKYLKIILGTAIMALGTAQFLLNVHLSTGGFTGIATVGHFLFNLPMGVLIMALNIPFFIFAYFRIGKIFVLNAVIGTASLSTFMSIFETYEPFTDDSFLACIYGGALIGLGIAMVLSEKGSTGGSDLLANLIRSYKPDIKASNIIVIIDIIIVGLNVLFFKKIEIALYSAIAIFVMGKVTDVFFEGIDFIKVIYIISKNSTKISEKINFEIKRGVTGIYSRGMYRAEDFTMLMCVASRNEVIKIMKIVKRIDNQAFVVVSNAREVIGKGFKKA